MESILARALEYTLKYWLKSFSRDQFKLQGRTVQLSDLDINGGALHSSMGLPEALHVTTAKVGKLEIMLPTVSNVQIEPIIVQIDRLDLVIKEDTDLDAHKSAASSPLSSSSAKGSGYGFADKIADGMTIEVQTVNLLLETRGCSRQHEGAAWASPMASVTIRNLLLYTTNENWQVVNLREARDFSSNKNFIYLFRKLGWESLSVDLLPHPDMFMDPHIAASQEGTNRKEDDGAKRVFFGGERFIEGVSGQANITVQRTALNTPLGLEVQLHIPEAVCPALSEPGLRALLRFFTGLYVCLNRGDVDPMAQQSTEAAGHSLVSIAVDHIFLCIKDAEFQLELLMQSLFISRACVSDGENTRNFSKIMVSGLFLRDTFSRPPCTLFQPSMRAASKDIVRVPDFGENFCPPIYPLGELSGPLNEGVPLLCIHSLQVKPSPRPPSFTSQTVIDCQPLMIHLQEESCLRICSFLADGIIVNAGSILPDFSINSLVFTLKEFDLTVPFDITKSDSPTCNKYAGFQSAFAGARLRIENLFFSESPSLKLRLLNLEKDPACFSLWKGQPIDASQKKWTTKASLLSLSLETCKDLKLQNPLDWSSGLWRCVEVDDACLEVAMATADGCPLVNVPPPGGIVRIGVAFKQYWSNTSVEQLFFVLDLYAYFGRVSEKIARVRKNKSLKTSRSKSLNGSLNEKVPSDTAVSLEVKYIQLRFLEHSPLNSQGIPLVQFVGEDLFIKVSHRTLGGATAISSTLHWKSVEVDCIETEGNLGDENDTELASVGNDQLMCGNGFPQLRAVLWIHNRRKHLPNGSVLAVPFLDINMVHVIPYSVQDMECHSLSVSACIAGVRLGGGMSYAEALLHRFGILGADGGPGEGLSKGLENLSAGPFAKLFNASPVILNDLEERNGNDTGFLHLGKPDDIDISLELKDWLFALEGAQEMAQNWWFYQNGDVGRKERCWQATFSSFSVKAKSSVKQTPNGEAKLGEMQKEAKLGEMQKNPVELVMVGVEGLQISKPRTQNAILQSGLNRNGIEETFEKSAGINLEARMVISEGKFADELAKWMVDSFKLSVKQPIEVAMTKEELQYLAFLGKSEIDSMGRIVAGVIRVLKLEKSIGQATMDQLTNLGTEGFEKIFSPDSLSSASSAGSFSHSTPLNSFSENTHPTMESTVASLEEAVLDSQAQCTALIAEMENSETSSQYIGKIELLNQRFESMQSLLAQFRTRV